MFVDIWIVGLFSLLFGFCAWWNFTSGVKRGIETTLFVLEKEKVISIVAEGVVPYRKGKKA